MKPPPPPPPPPLPPGCGARESPYNSGEVKRIARGPRDAARCACCRLLAASALFIGIAFTSLRSLGVYAARERERRATYIHERRYRLPSRRQEAARGQTNTAAAAAGCRSHQPTFLQRRCEGDDGGGKPSSILVFSGSAPLAPRRAAPHEPPSASALVVTSCL